MTIGEWLASRELQPPEQLSERLAIAIGDRAGIDASEVPQQFLAVALAMMQEMLASGATGRGAALRPADDRRAGDLRLRSGSRAAGRGAGVGDRWHGSALRRTVRSGYSATAACGVIAACPPDDSEMTELPPPALAGSPFTASLRELAALAEAVASTMGPELVRAHALVAGTVKGGGTLFFCGNGGSAADAQHLATEYVVRYMKNRRAYPAIALTTDTSLLTAAGNDFGFDMIFARQVEALARPGDLLIIHSTSGTSPNVIKAAEAALGKDVQVLAFLARDGGALRALATHSVIIPTDRTDRAQELHLCIGSTSSAG